MVWILSVQSSKKITQAFRDRMYSCFFIAAFVTGGWKIEIFEDFLNKKNSKKKNYYYIKKILGIFLDTCLVHNVCKFQDSRLKTVGEVNFRVSKKRQMRIKPLKLEKQKKGHPTLAKTA